MADTPDSKLIDKRTAQRYIQSGQLDEKAYERHVKSLPDVADKAVPVQTTMADFGDDELDDEDDDEGVGEGGSEPKADGQGSEPGASQGAPVSES